MAAVMSGCSMFSISSPHDPKGKCHTAPEGQAEHCSYSDHPPDLSGPLAAFFSCSHFFFLLSHMSQIISAIATMIQAYAPTSIHSRKLLPSQCHQIKPLLLSETNLLLVQELCDRAIVSWARPLCESRCRSIACWVMRRTISFGVFISSLLI